MHVEPGMVDGHVSRGGGRTARRGEEGGRGAGHVHVEPGMVDGHVSREGGGREHGKKGRGGRTRVHVEPGMVDGHVSREGHRQRGILCVTGHG